MSKKKLLIIGASGHGKVVSDIAHKMGNWELIEFLDDNKDLKLVNGFQRIGNLSEVNLYIREYDIFIAIGNNKIRENLFEDLKEKHATIPVLIHPNAVIGLSVDIGSGTVIMAGVVINSGTNIGNGCIINTGTTLDHDNSLCDYVHVSPGVHLAGTVTIKNGCWLGIGTIVKNNLVICENVITGAGAVVVKDIKVAGTYVGVPARRV